jgi:hypothetical protein
MQRVVGTKCSLPSSGLGEPGTNTHDMPRIALDRVTAGEAEDDAAAASSGTSTTCAKMPTCVSASATCFHDSVRDRAGPGTRRMTPSKRCSTNRPTTLVTNTPST